VFENSSADLDELVDIVTDYINFCCDCCVPEKVVQVHSNKPWITKDLRTKIKAKHKLLKAGDREALHTAQQELNVAIAEGKEAYKQKLESYFTSSDSRAGWQGLKDLLNRFSSFKDNCFHKKKNFILIIVFFVSCKYLHWFLSYDENNNFAYSWTGPESPDSQTSIMLI
jgi:hypothetical protein